MPVTLGGDWTLYNDPLNYDVVNAFIVRAEAVRDALFMGGGWDSIASVVPFDSLHETLPTASYTFTFVPAIKGSWTLTIDSSPYTIDYNGWADLYNKTMAAVPYDIGVGAPESIQTAMDNIVTAIVGDGHTASYTFAVSGTFKITIGSTVCGPVAYNTTTLVADVTAALGSNVDSFISSTVSPTNGAFFGVTIAGSPKALTVDCSSLVGVTAVVVEAERTGFASALLLPVFDAGGAYAPNFPYLQSCASYLGYGVNGTGSIFPAGGWNRRFEKQIWCLDYPGDGSRAWFSARSGSWYSTLTSDVGANSTFSGDYSTPSTQYKFSGQIMEYGSTDGAGNLVSMGGSPGWGVSPDQSSPVDLVVENLLAYQTLFAANFGAGWNSGGSPPAYFLPFIWPGDIFDGNWLNDLQAALLSLPP